jgi:hypothetical protein
MNEIEKALAALEGALTVEAVDKCAPAPRMRTVTVKEVKRDAHNRISHVIESSTTEPIDAATAKAEKSVGRMKTSKLAALAAEELARRVPEIAKHMPVEQTALSKDEIALLQNRQDEDL